MKKKLKVKKNKIYWHKMKKNWRKNEKLEIEHTNGKVKIGKEKHFWKSFSVRIKKTWKCYKKFFRNFWNFKIQKKIRKNSVRKCHVTYFF